MSPAPIILLIVYAFIAEVSVGSLFLEAVMPGLLLAFAYFVTIGFFLPIFALVALVIGGIYTGLFTPTESSAVGAAGAFILTLVRRNVL